MATANGRGYPSRRASNSAVITVTEGARAEEWNRDCTIRTGTDKVHGGNCSERPTL
jgi:ribosomal protein S12 methylthiotransferase accessory factor YcaO